MKNNIKELKAELLKVFSKFEENECEAKFEAGKWYKRPNTKVLTLMRSLPDSKCYKCTGFDSDGIFFKDGQTWLDGEVSATDSEVIEAFTNYFRSQGWVSGKTKFKDACEDVTRIYIEPISVNECGVYADDGMGRLFFNDTLTLATKIEEEKIMVGDKEVRFFNAGIINYCTIGSLRLLYKDVESLLTLNPIFQKILDRLNEK